MNDLCKKLSEPFDPTLVSWRIGPTNQDKSKGMALAYIDARDVMRRLDEVCGPENWQDEYPWSDGKRVVCRIGIKILTSAPDDPNRQYEWIWKTDGAGDTDTEGEKGALSDAFKRAAVKWGVGRYLYNTDTPWVEIEQRGKSYIIKQAEHTRLQRTLGGKAASPASPPILPANPEEPPEVAQSRESYARILRLLKNSESEAVSNDIWTINKADIALIKKHGGAAAIAMLNEVDQKRRDALRTGVAA